MIEPGPILVVIERLQTRVLHLEALIAERDRVIEKLTAADADDAPSPRADS